jgi:predicted amidohydrolase
MRRAGGNEVDLVVDALEAARSGDRALPQTIATLWTWLDRHLLTLGSLREKPLQIYLAAHTEHLEGKGFSGHVTDEEIASIRANPLRNSAYLLARIGFFMDGPGTDLATHAEGIDGGRVLVVKRNPALALAAHPHSLPPTAQEHPSLSTLAPRLNVCPQVSRGIKLEVADTYGAHWRSFRTRMHRGLGKHPPEVQVHLNPLRDRGMTKWTTDPAHKTAFLDSRTVRRRVDVQCTQEVRNAVKSAAGEANLLVMPELSTSARVREKLKSHLSRLRPDQRPAGIVSGLYHAPHDSDGDFDREILSDTPLGGRVNEAVMLGGDGTELLRHRKLSSAAGALESDEMRDYYTEDIVLGSKLQVAPTPLGMLTLLICLDSFVPHVRERVLASPAEVLLIPSLSPTVRRHRTSVEHLAEALWAIAFVCNRALSPTPTAPSIWNCGPNRSFWSIQRESVTVPPKATAKAPWFIFDVADHRRRGSDEGSNSRNAER